jgi:hypothetical protein
MIHTHVDNKMAASLASQVSLLYISDTSTSGFVQLFTVTGVAVYHRMSNDRLTVKAESVGM